MATGERIKYKRKEQRISADMLAKKIGVSRSTIFRYENGDIEKVTLRSLEPIARVLNTSVAYLMGWEDDAEASLSEDEKRFSRFLTLFKLLTDSEQKMIVAQIKGILDSRSRDSDPLE